MGGINKYGSQREAMLQSHVLLENKLKRGGENYKKSRYAKKRGIKNTETRPGDMAQW